MSTRFIALCICTTAIAAAACHGKTEGTSTASSTGATSATSSGPATTPTGTATPSASTPVSAFACPLPKRCTQACKDAFWKAGNTCSPDSQAMMAAMGKEAADAYGKCSAACITHHDQCIGSATAEECRCAEDCKKALPATVMAQLAPYEKCMASIVAACQ